MAGQDKQTLQRQCGHCGRLAEMAVVHSESHVEEYEDQRFGPNSSVEWSAGDVYNLLVCPGCKGVILEKYGFHDAYDPDEWPLTTLYPGKDSLPAGIPADVRSECEAALKVRMVDPNSYGVRLGRALERVCSDRGAQGKDLYAKLNDLAAKNEIPEQVNALAQSLRKLRNVGGHAGLGDLTEAEIPLLDSLYRAVLEYVYTAPQLIEQAEERYRELKEQEKQRRLTKGKD